MAIPDLYLLSSWGTVRVVSNTSEATGCRSEFCGEQETTSQCWRKLVTIGRAPALGQCKGNIHMPTFMQNVCKNHCFH